MGILRALFATLGAYVAFIRPWHVRWGATDEEVAAYLPGDERVPRPVIQSTRAITIDTPAEAVWPWLAQMGWRRAGWYTLPIIDAFDLRARDGRVFNGKLVERIIPELQNPRVGELLDPTGFRVAAVEPNHALVLEIRGGIEGMPWLAGNSTWAFVLHPLDAQHTRLIERWRLDFPASLRTQLFWGVVECADFVMQRTQLRHIRRLAERAWAGAASVS
jgi:hypothetical protein